MKGIVYLIENQVNNKKYVGKTYQTLQNRWKEHCKTAKRDEAQHRPLYRAINKYGIENFSISIIEQTDNLEEREKFWINYYNSYAEGYNATLGGDGRPYISYTNEEIIEKYNQTKSIQETAKFFEIDRDSVSLRLKAAGIDIPIGGDIYNDKRLWKASQILQFSLDNNFIQEFASMSEAANFLITNNITKSQVKHIVTNIGRCCKNQRKSAYGFIWKIKDLGE